VNRHLSTQDISRCLIGEGLQSEARHARECAECGAELALLETSLGQFRHAVRQWGERVDRASYQPVMSRSRLFLSAAALDARAEAGGGATRAGASSLLMHAAAVALAFTLGSTPQAREATRSRLSFLTAVQLHAPQPNRDRAEGGGGGGARQTLEASRGSLPKAAPRQFTPPRVDPVPAELLLPPSLDIPATITDLRATTYGDPLGREGPVSNGRGSGGGIGDGNRGGVGPGTGSGYGPGADGGFGSGVYTAGGSVSAPVLLHQVEPEYSEDARKAKWQGIVMLAVVVDERGRVREVTVVRSLGLGLDEKAIEAVRQWRFRPGMLNGSPVPVRATVEVNFRLL
jgi:TonB family protein